MATSTTTLLELTNRILDSIAEKRTESVTTNPTRTVSKVQTAIRRAQNLLVSEGKWVWLLKSANASSWTNETATVSDCMYLYRVVHGSDTLGYRIIPEVPQHTFNILTPTDYTATSTIPNHFVRESLTTFKFNPYPGNASRQAELTFEYLRTIDLPTVDSGTFSIPEDYIDLLQYKAIKLMALEHMLRPDLAQQYENEYQNLLFRFKQRDIPRPATLSFFNNNAQGFLKGN